MNSTDKKDIKLIHIKDVLPEVLDEIIGEHREYDLVDPIVSQNDKRMINLLDELKKINNTKYPFISLSSRPYVGKSVLALNTILCETKRSGKSAIFFSEVFPEKLFVQYLLTIESGVEFNKIRTRTYSNEEIQRILIAAKTLQSLNIILIDIFTLCIEQLESLICTTENPGLIVFDDIFFLESSIKEYSPLKDKKEFNKYLSVFLQRFSKEHKIPIIVSTLISRIVRHRYDRKPIHDDMINTINDFADFMVCIYRPWQSAYDYEWDDENQAKEFLNEHNITEDNVELLIKEKNSSEKYIIDNIDFDTRLTRHFD